jgi:hypothetical protein
MPKKLLSPTLLGTSAGGASTTSTRTGWRGGRGPLTVNLGVPTEKDITDDVAAVRVGNRLAVEDGAR